MLSNEKKDTEYINKLIEMRFTAMADAFRMAVIAGRQAYEAGLGAIADCAEASSPLTAFLNE